MSHSQVYIASYTLYMVTINESVWHPDHLLSSQDDYIPANQSNLVAVMIHSDSV